MPFAYSTDNGTLIIYSAVNDVPNGIEVMECTQEELDAVLPTDGKSYIYFVDVENKLISRTERGSSLSLVQRVGVQEEKNEHQDVRIVDCETSILDITLQVYVSSSSGSGTTPDTGGGSDSPGHN